MKNQIKEKAVQSIRKHRSPIGVCMLIVLALFIAGQIIAGPNSWPFPVGLFFLALLVHFSRTHYGKTFLAFVLLTVFFVGFLYVKGATASSGNKNEVKTISYATLVPTPVTYAEPEKEKQPVEAEKATSKAKPTKKTCKELKMFDLNIQQWCSYIKKYSNKEGVDPLLVASIIKPESGGNQTSVSWAGATGIMQVMPREAGFYDRPTAKELLDPETNIKAGVKILADCFSTYGNLRDSVQCYYGFGEGYYYADVLVLPTYEAAIKGKSIKN